MDTSRVHVRTSDMDTVFFVRQAARSDSGEYELSVQIENMKDTAAIRIRVVGARPAGRRTEKWRAWNGGRWGRGRKGRRWEGGKPRRHPKRERSGGGGGRRGEARSCGPAWAGIGQPRPPFQKRRGPPRT